MEVFMKAQQITATFNEMDKVEELAKEAFPPEEYLAPSTLLEMVDRGEIDFWGLYDEERFVGFMVTRVYHHLCYLFFLAINPLYRSKGYGGQALRLLDNLYHDKQQVVDFEMIDPAAANNQQRITRRAFYVRNGYKDTGKFLSYLGVDYEILCKDDVFDFDTFKEMMKHFSIEGFNPKYFEK